MDFLPNLKALFVVQTQKDSDSYLYSHPKIKKLEEVVLNHFQSMAGEICLWISCKMWST